MLTLAAGVYHTVIVILQNTAALLPHASKVLLLAPSVTCLFFFVCASNISGTAERICAKIHREDVFGRIGPSLG